MSFQHLSKGAILLLLFCSCRQGIKNAELEDEFERESTTIIDAQNKTLYTTLEEKVHDPRTAEEMKYWKPRADSLKKISSKARDIGNFQLKNINEESLTSQFSDALMLYRQRILSLSPEINQYFERDALFKMPVTKIKKYVYFKSYSTIMENKILNFIKASSGGISEDFSESVAFLLNQNAIHFNTGDTLIINAGTGVFSSAATPKIQIKNQQLEILNGVGTCRFILKESPGRYTIPVRVNYKNENGETIERVYQVEYFIDK